MNTSPLLVFASQINIQHTRERHVVNNAEREDIKRLLKCMLDTSWAGNHGDHSTLCDMCNMADIWFKLAEMLLDSVFPEGGSSLEEEVLSSVAFGALCGSYSSNKTVSVRSLSKCAYRTLNALGSLRVRYTSFRTKEYATSQASR